MSEEIAVLNVTINSEDAIAAINKLNSALDKLDNAGQVQVRRLQAIDSVIDDLAASYGENADKAKVLFKQMSANVGTTSEYKDTVSELAKAQAFLTRSMSQGATFEKATINLRKKQITDANKLNKALAEQAATTNKTSKSRKKSAEVVETEAEKYDRLLAVADAANKYAERLSNNSKKGQLDTNSVGFETQIKQQEKLAEAEQKAIQKAVDAYEDAEKQKKAIADRALVDANNKKFGVAEPKTKEQIKSYKDMYTELIAEKTKTDSILNSKMKQFTSDAMSYDKKQENSAKTKAENVRTAEEKMFDEITKNNMDRLAASEKAAKTEADTTRTVLNEKIKLMREYMSFQNQIDNGQIDKKKANSINPDKMSRISQGKDIFDQAQADPAKFEELARAAASWRANLDSVNASQARFVDSAKKAEEGVKSFTLSWQTMGRILVAQAFSQVFFGMQNAISAAVKEAEELYKAVAEIQTITERASQGALAYATALQSVIATSSKINFTPQDTANAFYETLSNQIGENVTQINSFIESAGALGKVTRATLADSTDAISAVMNAYNLGIGEASNVSAKLFTLVDQGRLKLAEVANSMGNVTVPAAQLGVDFDNVVAGLSAISIAGVAPRESMTLFRNIMFKLIDPTEAMTKLFAEWGVASGQAAIATFGFEGVLARLNIEARKGNAEIAELLGTIRAVRGVLGLTDENFEKYAKALDASRKAHENYSKIVDEYINNPGEQFRKLLQQTSNEFLQIGLQIVNAVSYMAKFVGNTKEGTFILAELAGVAAKLVFVLGAAAAAFFLASSSAAAAAAAASVFAVAAGTATGATAALGTALTALGLTPPVLIFSAFAAVIVSVGAAMVAFTKTTKQMNAEIAVAAQEANKDVGKSYSEGIIAAYKTITDEFNSRVRKTLEMASKKVQNLAAELQRLEGEKGIEKVIDRFKRLEDALGGTEAEQRLFAVISSLEDAYAAFGDQLGVSNKQLEDSKSYYQEQENNIQGVIDKLKEQKRAIMDLVASNRLNLEVSITERNFSGLEGKRKAEAQYAAAQDAANRAMNVADPEEAKKLFDIARKFLSDSEATAFESGALGNLQNHINFFNSQEKALYAAQERRLAAENELIDVEGRRQQLLLEEANTNRTSDEAELKRRQQLKETYEVQRTFLEYYDKKLKEIASDTKTNNEQKIAQEKELNRLYEEGMKNGSMPNDPAFLAALDLRRSTSPIRAEMTATEAQAQKLTTDTSDINNAQAAFNKIVSDSASKLSESATKFEESLNIVRNSVLSKETPGQIFPGGAYMGPPDATTTGELAKLYNEFRASRAAFEAKKDKATPEDLASFEAVLNGLIVRLEALSKTKGTAGSKDALIAAKNALAEVQAAKGLIGDGAKGLDKARTQAEADLSTLNALVTPVDTLTKAVEDNTKAAQAVASYLSKITTYGSSTPSPEATRQAQMIADQQAKAASSGMELDPVSQRDQYFAQSGNAGSGELEGDTGPGDGEVQQGLLDQEKKAQEAYLKKQTTIVKDQKSAAKDNVEAANKQIKAAIAASQAQEEARLRASAPNQVNSQSQSQGQNQQNANQQPQVQTQVQGSKSRGQLIYEEQQDRIEFFQTEKSRGQLLYEEQQKRLAIFAQEQQQLQQQQQLIDMQRQVAEADRQRSQQEFNGQGLYRDGFENRGLINGQPVRPDDSHYAQINGQNYMVAPDRRDFGMVNGEQLAPTVGDAVSTAAWSSVPNAMAQGAQSIPQAMSQGSSAISQAVVDGMAYAFRQQQQAESQGVHYAQPERRFAKGGPVGTDTIPAWLSPGEFVVNAQATKRNFSWLQAINSPSAQRFSKGGPVTNSQSFTNTFNLHTKNPNMQANQIVNAVRRQVAQGKATLTKGRPY